MRLVSLAWVSLAEKKDNAALRLMRQAADMEDKTEKNIVTPGRLLPARELLGDMLDGVEATCRGAKRIRSIAAARTEPLSRPVRSRGGSGAVG